MKTIEKRSITAESVINTISEGDVQDCLEGIKEVTEKYLYHCAKNGRDPEFGYSALMNVTKLLNEIQRFNQQGSEQLQAVGM